MIRTLKNWFHFVQAFLANLVYQFPSKNLIIIGVTGTDGKTTTVHLIYEILKKAGLNVELVSTLTAPGLHTTTPNSLVLQRLLREMIKRNTKYVVLEASSHGLDQHRLWGIKFDIGVVTNITHDHLDYHRTYENYLKAKARLFKGVKFAILNQDDQSYEYLRKNIRVLDDKKIITYGIINKAKITPDTFKFKTGLSGKYNQYNCLAAIAVAVSLNIPQEIIKRAIVSFSGLSGRMEKINGNQEFTVIVDFASTPNALKQVLTTLRSQIISRSRLIVVFGSAGLRDIQKRPIMGGIASKLADISVLTSEDPRTEDPNKIIEQIAHGYLEQGGIKGKTFFQIPDRREAIKFAIKIANKGDVVVLCGKGHEQSICYGKLELPWNEQEEARKAINEKYQQ